MYFKIEKTLLLFLSVMFIASTFAEELSLPTTKHDIIDHLSIKKGEITNKEMQQIPNSDLTHKDVVKEILRFRGLHGVSDIDTLPKVGALIQFDYNSAKIKSESYALLDEYGSAFSGELSDAFVLIVGHADSVGSIQYNKDLSQKRATAVIKYLIDNHNISADHISVFARGEEQPIASNDTPQGRAKNRRVEFIRIR